MSDLESVVPILNLDDLKVISPVGRGAKGVVFLVKHEQCGELWALKVISRDLIEMKKNRGVCDVNDQYKRVSFERRVLSHFKHPLLPSLRGVLATDKIVGYAIDFCAGRDLNHLRKQQTEKMFSVDIIRFYAAELVLALEYLHKIGIAYRDLKPENILIQENGHIMLVDFDLSTKISQIPGRRQDSPPPKFAAVHHQSRRKRSFLNRFFCSSGITPDDSSNNTTALPEPDPTEKSNSFVGTEEYVAPEVIQGYGHDFAVDLWSLGIVLYEMLYGATPFKGSNRKETFFRILTKTPDLVGEPTPLRDLIRKLLVKDPKQRMKLEEIKKHEFFQGINWKMLVQLSRPPYIPPASHEIWAAEGKDGAAKVDVESFVQKIFVREEAGKQKDGDLNKKEEGANKGMWVNGLDHSRENHNFNVF